MKKAQCASPLHLQVYPSKKNPLKYGVSELVKYVKNYVDFGKLMFVKFGYKSIKN